MSSLKLMDGVIKRQILREVEMPTLIAKTINVESTTLPFPKTKKIIKLTQEEFRQFASDPNSWMFDEHRIAWEALPDNAAMAVDPGYEFSDVIFYGGIERMIPSFFDGYGNPMIPRNNDVIMAVYGAEDIPVLSMRNEILQKYVTDHKPNNHDGNPGLEIPSYKFILPNKIRHTVFEKSVYKTDVFLTDFQDPCVILMTNVPYNYYAYQPLLPSAYTWSEENQCHQFDGASAEEFEEIKKDICENGINMPIYFTAYGDILMAHSTIDYIRLMVAKLFHIPSVPAIILVTNEHTFDNATIKGIVKYTNGEEDKIHQSTEMMRNIFAPYIIFAKDDEIHDDTITVNDVSYKRAFYIEKTRCDHCRVMCLDTSVDFSGITSSEEAVEEAVNRLRRNAKQQLSDSIEKARRLLEGR